jgi:hypothetical protein
MIRYLHIRIPVGVRVGASVGDSVGASVGDSVGDAVVGEAGTSQLRSHSTLGTFTTYMLASLVQQLGPPWVTLFYSE